MGPVHAPGPGRQAGLLALLQRGRQLHDGVAAQRHAHVVQRLQNLCSQGATAGAKLPHFVAATVGQRLRHLLRQRVAKQGADFRGGDKVASAGAGQGAEFDRFTRVIAQAGGVERHFHKAVKADPAARLGDGAANVGVQGAVGAVRAWGHR